MWKMLGGWNFPSTLSAVKTMTAVHRGTWLAAASHFGVLGRLADGPKSFDELARAIVPDQAQHPAFRAWLRHGVLLKELAASDDTFALRGAMSKRIAAGDDSYAALIEAMVNIHVGSLWGVMEKITKGEAPSLADMDAPLVARVAMGMAPLMEEVIDRVLPSSGAHAVLELGCGAAGYLRHACERNPEATAVGLDFDADVLADAREHVAAAGMSDRVELIEGDMRTIELDQKFDTVLMINLLYYVPVAERAATIAKLAGHLAPGGRLMIAGNCHGGTVGNNVLDIWFTALPECGGLPSRDETMGYLKDAGLEVEPPLRPMPGEEFYAITGVAPAV